MKNTFGFIRFLAIAVFMAAALLVLFAHSASAAPTATTFVVNSIGDGNDTAPGNGVCATAGNGCTLRAAIQEANALTGDDTIRFNLGACPCAISVSSALPWLTDDGTTIDGYSQPGSVVNTSKKGMNAKIMVRLSGLSAGDGVNGLYITGGDATVKGLEIYAFQGQGIVLGTNGGNDIEGNLIHENAAGGIYVASSNNEIGQDTLAGRNALYTNGAHGIQIWGDYNYLHNNLIGIGPNGGNVATGNLYTGVAINTSHNQLYKNQIAYNHNSGVVVTSGLSNSVYLNSIYSNSQYGIDLGNNGITLNDAMDSDSGADGLQNFPALTSATAATKTIAGKVTTTPQTYVTLYFYATPQCDANGYGEGKKYLGSASVHTNNNGTAKFSAVVKRFKTGNAITATGIGNAGTSEFSACVTAK